MMTQPLRSLFEQELEADLTARYGPLLTGGVLRQILGYPSQDAFRQAIARKNVPVPVFMLENRRGRFAFTRDVAVWLAAQRERVSAKD